MRLWTVTQGSLLGVALIVFCAACGDDPAPAPAPGPSDPAAVPAEIPKPAPQATRRAIPPHPPVPSTPALEKKLPELHFVGVTGLYALQRIATESGALLGIDQSYPLESASESSFTRARVDIDIPAGSTVGDALQTIYEDIGGFHYGGRGGGIYLRSTQIASGNRAADDPLMPVRRYKGNFVHLRPWLLQGAQLAVLPKIYPGTPSYQDVDFKTEEALSVIDFMMRYGNEVGSGWILARPRPDSRNPKPTVGPFAIKEVGLLRPRVGFQRDRFSFRTSLIASIVDISEQTGVPICLVDWSGSSIDLVPSLSMETSPQPRKSTALEALRLLASPAPTAELFRFEERGDVILAHSAQYDLLIAAATPLLTQQVKGGSFSGSLGELARWLNRNHLNPGGGKLLAGELFVGDPVSSLEISEGATIQKVLLDFAARTGNCWSYFRHGFPTPAGSMSGEGSDDAFLFPIELWHRNGLEGLAQRKSPPTGAVSRVAPPADGSGSP